MRLFYYRTLTSAATFTLCALVGACTSQALPTANLANVDLSGKWIVQPRLSDPTPSVAPNNDGSTSSRRRRDDHLGSLRPVVRARAMIIEQTANSMGIDYAGFPYRDVSWGKRQRDTFEVVAGWLEEELHIRSKRGRMQLSEIYRLSADQQTLELVVKFKGGSLDGRTFARVFARQN